MPDMRAEEAPKTLQVTRDSLNRLAEVRETSRSPVRVDTFDYDLNGNLKTRVDDATDGQLTTTGRQHDFTWDQRDLLDFHYDSGKSRPATSDDRDVDTSYLPTGWIDTRVVRAHDGTAMRLKQRTDYAYFLNGLLDTQTTSNGAGAVRESHDISYLDGNGRFLNGNPVTDAFRLLGPNSAAPCRTATCTRSYTYDARERVTHEETSTSGASGDYTFDAAGNLTYKKIIPKAGATPQETRLTYRGSQLDTARDAANPNTIVSRFWYDPFGNLECVTGDTTDRQGVCDSWNAGTHSSQLQAHYSYDVLDRMVSGSRYGAGQLQSDSSYIYDALDRPSERRERKRLSGEQATPESSLPRGIRKFSYVGLTRDASNETWDPQRSGQGTTTKDYSYDALGTRVAMTARRGTNPTKELTFGSNPHGDVSLLLGDDGEARGAYAYLAYGDADEQLTDERDFETPANPSQLNDPTSGYRYSSKRTDPGTDTLDMGARRFSPSTGGFLQADQYGDALANLGLSSDPLTANRYSLAAGNPIRFVETDGHDPHAIDTHHSGCFGCGGTKEGAQATADQGNAGSGVNKPSASTWPRQTNTQVLRQRPPAPPRVDSKAALLEHYGHKKVPTAEIDDLLDRYEAESGNQLSSHERTAYSTALRQGDLHERLDTMGPNPYAGPVAVAVLTTWPGGAGATALGAGARGAVGRTAAGEGAAATSGVAANRTAGNAFRDTVADRLENELGFNIVGKEVTVRTPLGRRVFDILGERNGGLVNFETKLGGSRYLPRQRAKDFYLSRFGADVLGTGTRTKIPTVVIRGPLK